MYTIASYLYILSATYLAQNSEIAYYEADEVCTDDESGEPRLLRRALDPRWCTQNASVFRHLSFIQTLCCDCIRLLPNPTIPWLKPVVS